MDRITCHYCGSAEVIKKGVRKDKLRWVQLYHCKRCDRTFSQSPMKHVKYPPRVILNAVSLYNLGYVQREVTKLAAKMHHLKIPERTINSWINRFRDVCTFHRLRKQATKLFSPRDIISSIKLQHKQIYEFKLHRAKQSLQARELPRQKFQLLKAYLEKISTKDFPHHIFTVAGCDLEQRASQLKFESLDFAGIGKHNLANRLAELGLMLARTNRERHPCVQNFMIMNDSCTVACEVPVYLTHDDIEYFRSRGFTFSFENYRTPITGHIDLLQIRNGLIHILDYKPEAEKVNAVNQLVIYALALA